MFQTDLNETSYGFGAARLTGSGQPPFIQSVKPIALHPYGDRLTILRRSTFGFCDII